MKLTYTNGYGETMFLEESERKGHYYFFHEDINKERIELPADLAEIPFILLSDELAVLNNFKLIILSK